MRSKKRLGQNFLISPRVAERMVETAGVTERDFIVEVGPGKGILTKALLKRAKKVIAIEKDAMLISYLKNKFKKEIGEEKLVLLCGDALTYKAPAGEYYKFVSNIPYYITGEIFRHFLSETYPPTSITVMVQREVADRIVARNKKESVLSLSIKAYGEPRVAGHVSAGNFFPKPKVNSAVIHVTNISKKFFAAIPEDKFFAAIKAGFSHKRKVLIKNLAGLTPKTKLERFFAELHLSPTVRAEEISLSAWRVLLQKME